MDNQIGKKVAHWFRENGRQLPWRETDDPYYILVSEVMLQQTQVTTVIPYYLRFIETLPTLTDLAGASEELLHTLWEGLGYYSRVHRLKQFAIRVINEYEGQIPNTKEALIKLPGIGPYTVGAVLSFAFNVKEPAIDGNVNRVIARLFNNHNDVTKVSTKREFHDYVLQIMDEDIYSFNQGLIELGALICIPKTPRCERCPLISDCMAYKLQTTKELPNKPKKKKQVIKRVPVFIIMENEEILFVQRKSSGLLANMFGLPMMDSGVELSKAQLLEPLDDVKNLFEQYSDENFGIKIEEDIKYIGQGKHVFSHIIWEQYVYLIHTNGLKHSLKAVESPVIKWSLVNKISIPTAFKKSIEVLKTYFEDEMES